jgi:hypothetical protein
LQKEKGKTCEGKPWRANKVWPCCRSCAYPVPDASMHRDMGFVIGIWVVFCVVVRPVLGPGIPVISKLVL